MKAKYVISQIGKTELIEFKSLDVLLMFIKNELSTKTKVVFTIKKGE